MKKRILSVLLCLCMVMALLPTTALAVAATDIQVTDATYYENGAAKSVTTAFMWNQPDTTSRLVLMTNKLRSAGENGANSVYGDFSNEGSYASSFANFDAVKSYDATNKTFGIISDSGTDASITQNQTNTLSISFENTNVPLSVDKMYYVYLWTQHNEHCYPDNLILAFKVENGGLKYAIADTSTEDRNALSSTWSGVVSQQSYSVKVNSAANMSRKNDSGAENQNNLTTAMTPVVYTANTGYYFPEGYSVATVNGIMVRRDSETQITVYGTPSANAEIRLAAPTAITTYTVTFNVQGIGTVPASQQVANGEKVTEPPAPTADDYTFGGWYKEAGCTTPWAFDTDTVTSATTLYAKWTATPSTTLEETNFTHAYDVQRNPEFPTKNQTITLRGLSDPYLVGGSQGNQNTGNWKLSKAGTYSYMKSIANSDNLDEIVADVVRKYTSLNSDAVVIHELKDGATHIAYGVVVAYDAANGNAVFLGDPLSGGAGYLLATGERTGTVYAIANEVATDYVQTATYGIALDVTGTHTFDAADYGYATPTAKTVTVTNTGTAATGGLIATLSGGASSAFTLTGANISSIANHGETATFTVVPKTGLSSGIYTEVVTVSGTNIVSNSFAVSFTVNAVAPTTYTVTFDPNGGSVSPTSAFVSAGGTLSSLPTPTHSGSYSFVGWYTAPTGGTQVTTSSVFNSNTTIYAQWTYTGGSYTPSIDSDDDDEPTYKVESEVSKDTDGTISSDHRTAGAGDEVTIKVSPDRYYKVDDVVIKDQNGKVIPVTDNKDGTFTFKMPSSKVTVEPVFSWDNPFADVAENAYYASAVEWALKNDITNGSGDASFSPDTVCTRAQIVTFLWRAAGCPEPAGTNSFTDVSADAYYAKAVAWAVEQGITNGTGGKFSPDAACTRAQVVAFLWRAEGSDAAGTANSFADVPANAYYTDAVNWAVENSITGGTSATTFSPAANCTRAQIVTFLYRDMVE